MKHEKRGRNQNMPLLWHVSHRMRNVIRSLREDPSPFLFLHRLFLELIFLMFWKSFVYLDLSFLFVSLFCAKAFEISILFGNILLYLFTSLLSFFFFHYFPYVPFFVCFSFFSSFFAVFSFICAYFYSGTTNRSETQDHVTKTQAKRNHR